MNNEWESISMLLFRSEKYFIDWNNQQKKCSRIAARKTVRDLLLNAVEFYRFLITYHNSYINVSPTHAFLFRINFIAHWFFIISSGLTLSEKVEWGAECERCFEQCFVLHMFLRSLARRRDGKCVCAKADKKFKCRKNLKNM
jgi:hypothetical protein